MDFISSMNALPIFRLCGRWLFKKLVLSACSIALLAWWYFFFFFSARLFAHHLEFATTTQISSHFSVGSLETFPFKFFSLVILAPKMAATSEVLFKVWLLLALIWCKNLWGLPTHSNNSDMSLQDVWIPNLRGLPLGRTGEIVAEFEVKSPKTWAVKESAISSST